MCVSDYTGRRILWDSQLPDSLQHSHTHFLLLLLWTVSDPETPCGSDLQLTLRQREKSGLIPFTSLSFSSIRKTTTTTTTAAAAALHHHSSLFLFASASSTRPECLSYSAKDGQICSHTATKPARRLCCPLLSIKVDTVV